MSIAIVTDSAADLPPALAEAYGVTVVPLEVRLGSDSFRDGLDLTTADFFRRVRAGVVPTTSQPPLGTFARVYRDLLTRHESIISIHIASEFSGTFDAAKLARQSLPVADISVVDSGSFTLGLGLQVIRAAQALRAGWGKDEVLRLLEETRRRTVVFGVLDTLEYLRLGGRINHVAFLLGHLLQVKPVIRVGQGRGVTLGKHRRRAQAIDDLLSRLEPGAGGAVGIMHTMAAAKAEDLRRRLAERGVCAEIVTEAGPAVGCHVGPRALGVAVVPAWAEMVHDAGPACHQIVEEQVFPPPKGDIGRV